MSLADSLTKLDLADARPRGRSRLRIVEVTLYFRNGRASFTSHPDASVATIAAPEGSEVLTVGGQPLLFVPSEPRVRHAWTAYEVWREARRGERGFGVLAGPYTPEQIRRRELYAAVKALRGQGLTQWAVGERLGIDHTRVSRIEHSPCPV